MKEIKDGKEYFVLSSKNKFNEAKYIFNSNKLVKTTLISMRQIGYNVLHCNNDCVCIPILVNYSSRDDWSFVRSRHFEIKDSLRSNS